MYLHINCSIHWLWIQLGVKPRRASPVRKQGADCLNELAMKPLKQTSEFQDVISSL